MEEKENQIEMEPENLKMLIEENQFLKYWLLSLNGEKMTKADEYEGDYMELWNNIALAKCLAAPEEVKAEEYEFYFKLFDTGLKNFGVKCFEAMASTDPVLLGIGINALIQYSYAAGEQIEKLSKLEKEKEA